MRELRCEIMYGVLALMACLLSRPVFVCADAPEAQWRGYGKYAYKTPYNFLSVSASVGYSNLITRDGIAKPYGLGGCTFGLGYEMHSNERRFWWSLNAEFEYITSLTGINHEVGERFIYDDENYLAVMHYDINRWYDVQQYMFISLPLMVGYRTGRFYIGAGPKLMLAAYTKGQNTIQYTTSATYDRYCDDFVVMPNHYYGRMKSTSLPARLQSDVSANIAFCFEVGATMFDETLPPRKMPGRNKEKLNPRIVLKLGFCAEYGFLNQNHGSSTENLVTVNQNKAHQLDVVPLFASNAMVNPTVNPFYAGVKFTVLVNFYCRNCQAIK